MNKNEEEYGQAEKREYLIRDNFINLNLGPSGESDDELLDIYPGDRPRLPGLDPTIEYFAPKVRYFITRNFRGYEVANVPNIPIIDFDFDPNGVLNAQQFEEFVLETTTSLSNNWRLYKTAGGYRVILTNKLIHQEDFDFAPWVNGGADEVYAKLCFRDNGFRARLSPKPERLQLPELCDVIDTKAWLKELDNAPPEIYGLYADWLVKYSIACNDKATCRLMKFEQLDPTPEIINEFLRYHDSVTKAHLAYTLA